jgi:hypothetical protein
MLVKNVEKVIEFDSLDVAKKVVSHLHHVEIDITADRALLKFIKFDGAAFDLARALEGVGLTGWKILNTVKFSQPIARCFPIFEISLDPNTIQELTNCFSRIEKAILAVSFQMYKSQRLTELVSREDELN